MTHPHDDEALKQFLRQHRPSIPPASPNLEARVMQAVEQPTSQTKGQSGKCNRRWLVPSAIAASVLVALASYQTVSFRQAASAKQTANVETFLENNWFIFADSSEAELFPSAEPATQSSAEDLVTTDL